MYIYNIYVHTHSLHIESISISLLLSSQCCLLCNETNDDYVVLFTLGDGLQLKVQNFNLADV